jgi:hypothetical protein
MLEILGTIFGSVFSGGATGLIGVALQRYADLKNKQLDMQIAKQKFDQDLALKQLDMQVMEKEWAGRVQVAQTEAEATADAAASQAFAASYAMEPKRYSEGVPIGKVGGFLLVLLDMFRGIVRPALTVYLCVLTTYVWLQVHQVLDKQPLSGSEALQIWQLIVGTILYLTTTCVLWWFGTRNKQQVPQLNK